MFGMEEQQPAAVLKLTMDKMDAHTIAGVRHISMAVYARQNCISLLAKVITFCFRPAYMTLIAFPSIFLCQRKLSVKR